MKSFLTTLDNGLRIISSSRPETETVSVGVWVNTGSAYEKVDNNGISHFLEHMAFKGTTTRSALEISESIENVGGFFNAYTSREFTAFYTKMLKNDLELAVDVLTDIICNSTFPEEEIRKEREVVVQEIKQTIDTPDDIIFDYFQEKAFPGQAVGRTVLGPVSKVRSFTRDTLNNYMQSNYGADNMVVCAVGNLEHNNFVEMVKKRMSAFRSKSNFVPDKQLYKGGFRAKEKEIEQAHVILGFNGFAYDSDKYYPEMLFSSLFGGGMSSRLFQEIREKRGLVYSVYSFINVQTQSGLTGIYAGTTQDELGKLLPVVIDEINKVRNEKVTPEELQRAKTQFKASLLMSLESSSSTSEVLARQMLLFDRIIPVEEMVDMIESVTLDRILDTAQEIFASTPTYVLLGSLGSNYMSYDETIQRLKA